MRWQTLFTNLPFSVVDDNPWSILGALDEFLSKIVGNGESFGKIGFNIQGTVYIAPDAVIEKDATIIGPAYIGPGVTIKQGAYLRGGVYLAKGAVVGHATEVKHALFLEDSHAPHFNYVGDSVLGREVNLGAGVKISNFKNDGSEIVIENIPTGLRKVGAFIGDGTKIGCNSVTAPGTIIGKDCLIYPLVSLRGIIPAESIVKLKQEQEIIPRRY